MFGEEDGKHIFGTVKVGDGGQVTLPKKAREVFDITTGDTLLVLGDERRGIVIVKGEQLKQMAMDMLGFSEK
ncbi:MAG: AbrB/MazE/SpoVT family DNA-binding domain-containing protein [Methanomicrobiales archaeon]